MRLRRVKCAELTAQSEAAHQLFFCFRRGVPFDGNFVFPQAAVVFQIDGGLVAEFVTALGDVHGQHDIGHAIGRDLNRQIQLRTEAAVEASRGGEAHHALRQVGSVAYSQRDGMVAWLQRLLDNFIQHGTVDNQSISGRGCLGKIRPGGQAKENDRPAQADFRQMSQEEPHVVTTDCVVHH